MSRLLPPLTFFDLSVLAVFNKTDIPNQLTQGEYTILAPTNAAFESIATSEMETLTDSKVILTATLSNHILQGSWTLEQLKTTLLEKHGKMKVKTINGNDLELFTQNGKVYLFSPRGEKVEFDSTATDFFHFNTLLLPRK